MKNLNDRKIVGSDTKAVNKGNVAADNPAICDEKMLTLQLWDAIEVDKHRVT